MNLLYCFDRNYNRQAFISISSFIEQNHSNLNIYIIHEDPSTFEFYEKKLLEKVNINLKVYRFQKPNNISLPFKDSDHVSEATYYRLFIENYLESDLTEILYIDVDVICLKNIEDIYLETIQRLNESKMCFAAKPSGEKGGGSLDFDKFLNSLNIDSTYFQAGVMFINLDVWKKLNFSENLISKLIEIRDSIVFWDQDVLNSLVNGSFLPIQESLNYISNNTNNLDNIMDQAYLLHYAGSKKPWTISGGVNSVANFYHELNLKIMKSYHIEYSYKRVEFINLIKMILNREILQLKSPIRYIMRSLINIIK